MAGHTAARLAITVHLRGVTECMHEWMHSGLVSTGSCPFQVLSDADKRQLYDQHGEAGLKRGFSGAAPAFNPRSADEIFREVLAWCARHINI